MAVLAGIAVAFAVMYSLVGLFRHWNFGSSAFDLGIFDQAIWHASRFEAPGSTINGFPTLLGDHFHPIILAFAPLYWIAPRPEALILAQAVLFAASIVPVFLFIRARLDRTPALLLAAAYGFFWGLQRAVDFDVHEIAFAPLFIALALLAFDRGRWLLFWTAVVGVGLVKEDLIVVLPFLGILLMALGERRRGAILLIGSTIAFLAVVRVVIPAFNDFGGYQYVGSFDDVLSRPWTLPQLLVTPPEKIGTALLWLAPFAFLPACSPFGWLIVPFVLTRLLSDAPAHWGTHFHYTAPLAPILATSAGDGLARLARRAAGRISPQRFATAAAGVSLLLSLFLPGNQPHWDLFEADHYRQTEMHMAGRRALAIVPPDASVVAQAAVVPHLTHRDAIYVLEAGAPDADIVIAAAALSPYPNESAEAVARLVDERRARGYRVIFDEHGWLVLRR